MAREQDLEKALKLAVSMLVKFEPGDSRAVSDEFVAIASVSAGLANNQCFDIIDKALERMDTGIEVEIT